MKFEKHNWVENYHDHKGHAVIKCSCGREFLGFNEEGAQKYFFQHKTQCEKTEVKETEQ